MIYWFTGQPGAGKTTLANKLKEHLINTELYTGEVFMVDGDDLRDLYENKDYTINGRVDNVKTAQRISKYLLNKGNTVIVSLVSPYLDQREEFKHFLNGKVKEIYVHTQDERGREHFFSSAYKQPADNYIDIDTTNKSIEEAFSELVEQIWPAIEPDYVEEVVEKKKTYFVDIDGTIFKYRKFGTYETEEAEVIPSTLEHLQQLNEEGHMIVLTTARPETLYEHTLKELNINNVPYHKLVMGIERGARYVINDKDPNVEDDRAVAINLVRDQGI